MMGVVMLQVFLLPSQVLRSNAVGVVYSQITKALSVERQNSHPFFVVGRIRTCAGRPQWISSPSP